MRLTETNPGNQYLVEEIQLELLTKEEVAHKILDEILKLKG